MKIFDQGTPVPLRKHLTAHHVDTATEMGWAELENGKLLTEAETAGFDLLITTDQNLRYQQNLNERKIGVVVLMTTSWPRITSKTEDVTTAIENLMPGAYVEVTI